MELTEQQTEMIMEDIRKSGITLNDLAESLLDHICCSIEQSDQKDFDTAYTRALAAFGTEGILQIQKETILISNYKNDLFMKKSIYVLAFIAASFTTTGLLFKVQHWPGAAILLTLGVALFNLGFLPLFCYDRYKKAVS